MRLGRYFWSLHQTEDETIYVIGNYSYNLEIALTPFLDTTIYPNSLIFVIDLKILPGNIRLIALYYVPNITNPSYLNSISIIRNINILINKIMVKYFMKNSSGE